MFSQSISRAAVLTATALGGLAGHELGDYVAQRDHEARNKQCHTRPHDPIDADDVRTPEQRRRDGWRALAIHASSYTVTQHLTKAVIYRAAGLHVPVLAQLAGSTVEGVLHAAIDDGRALRWLAEHTGSSDFHQLADHGINGKALQDQALHKGAQIPLGATVTALVAAAPSVPRGRRDRTEPAPRGRGRATPMRTMPARRTLAAAGRTLPRGRPQGAQSRGTAPAWSA